MKPWQHSRASVGRWGGDPKDYLAVHDLIDSSKAHVPDMRHRALLHSSFGIFIVERVFGTTITNSDGKTVSVRDVAEQHVIEDLGTIPTVLHYLDGIDPWVGGTGMPIYSWLGGRVRKAKTPREQVD